MTKNQLKNRLLRVNGLKLLDPWGVTGDVWAWDANSVWLFYPGLPLPFERSLKECADAANGSLRTDLEQQFVKCIKLGTGISMTFHYDETRVGTGSKALL